MCHQQDKKEKEVDVLGKRRKTSQSEEVSCSDDKPCDRCAHDQRAEQLIKPDIDPARKELRIF